MNDRCRSIFVKKVTSPVLQYLSVPADTTPAIATAPKSLLPSFIVVSTGAPESPKQALLSVRDRGPGVPESDLPRLQMPFVTLDPARTERNAGLGLALVAAISHMHGGTFLARNRKPGLETTLKLSRIA